MNDIMILILIVYICPTSIYGVITGACHDVYDSDKALAYSVIGLLFGWLIVPIKLIRGLYKIYKER